MCIKYITFKKHALMTFAEIHDARRSQLLVQCAIVVSQNQNFFEIVLYSVGIHRIYTLRYCIALDIYINATRKIVSGILYRFIDILEYTFISW